MDKLLNLLEATFYDGCRRAEFTISTTCWTTLDLRKFLVLLGLMPFKDAFGVKKEVHVTLVLTIWSIFISMDSLFTIRLKQFDYNAHYLLLSCKVMSTS